MNRLTKMLHPLCLGRPSLNKSTLSNKPPSREKTIRAYFLISPSPL